MRMQRIQLLPYSVTHNSEYVEFQLTPPCERPRDCVVQLYTMGYSHFNSGYRYDEVKPWSAAEAAIHRCQKMPLQQLLEGEGEWNVAATFRVDCTALSRYLGHDDIHILAGDKDLTACTALDAHFPADRLDAQAVIAGFCVTDLDSV